MIQEPVNVSHCRETPDGGFDLTDDRRRWQQNDLVSSFIQKNNNRPIYCSVGLVNRRNQTPGK
ncbi:hypothetical protein M9458_049866, partial [Cirrhinus mrigala]